ncbi:MAG: PEP-CTERM motif protein [Candidatus Scalindua rubra]|uniref:PEP-CTERM motif protein n=1 Tax=Candidatus Scalindua rubra TaxID=1872076 RepID=A0A1E3X3W2_9BACT|nr:MAG: PEP-CTERM motif protein [Candidatus Scalindua rubra]
MNKFTVFFFTKRFGLFKRHMFILVLVMSMLFIWPTYCQAIPYIYTQISGTSCSFSGFGSPSINDSGTVAFWADLDAGGSGIFTGNGGSLTTIADTSGSLSGFNGTPSINDSGTVAFWAALDAGGEGIVTGDGGSTTVLYDTSGSINGFDQVDPSINDSGLVAFQVDISGGDEGIYRGNGGPITVIAVRSSTVEGISPSINNFGTVSFKGLGGFSPGWPSDGIFTSSGGPLTTIADANGPFFFSGSSSNNTSINDSGMVAFWAWLDTGGHGIFTGPDDVVDKVIRTGDTLFGSTVTSLLFSRRGLNDFGQLAFYAELADGTSGIFRADPQTERIPEPATIALLGIGLASLAGGYVRRRRKQKTDVRLRNVDCELRKENQKSEYRAKLSFVETRNKS